MNKKNAVFVVLTTYQLYVASVYSKYIYKHYGNDYCTKIITVGLEMRISSSYFEVFSIPNLNGSSIKRIWQRLYWGGRFFRFTNIPKLFDSSKNNYLFVFNDNEPITNRIIRYVKKINSENVVTIIEEGIGIYEKTYKQEMSFQKALRMIVTTILGSPMKYSAVGDNSKIDYAIVEKPDLYVGTGKTGSQKVIHQNKGKLFEDGSAFLEMLDINGKSIRSYDVLFIGQPFDKYGKLIAEEEFFLNHVFQFAYENNLKVFVKPHPREGVEKYERFVNKNIEVCDSELSLLPIECLAKLIRTKIVITFNSSAGINIANTNQGVRCFFCYKIDSNSELLRLWSNGYTQINEDIFRNDNMFVPRTYDDLWNNVLNYMREDYDSSQKVSSEYEGFEEIDFLLC